MGGGDIATHPPLKILRLWDRKCFLYDVKSVLLRVPFVAFDVQKYLKNLY